MKVLVTGAAGMLGHALMPALAAAGHEALGLDLPELDVTDFDAMCARARAFAPDWIAHLAAFTRVDDCESRPDQAFRVNGLGPRNAALAAAACGGALLAISTDYVFDGAAARPYREYDPAGPRPVYGASKWAGEQAVRELLPRHAIVRTSWLFGPGGPNFVDTILERARSGAALRVVDDQRGSPTFTLDLAPALVHLMESGQYGTFHCTNSGDCTWHDLAAEALSAARLEAPLAPCTTADFPRPAPRPAYSVLSNETFEAATGRRLPPWADAVRRHVASRAAGRSS